MNKTCNIDPAVINSQLIFRLELYPEGSRPEMILMDQIEEVASELQSVKNESCIVLRMHALKVCMRKTDKCIPKTQPN